MTAITCGDVRTRDLAERYAAGRLGADVEEAFELHLLSCAACQDEVRFLAAARMSLRKSPAARSSRRRMALLGAVGAAAAAVVLFAVTRMPIESNASPARFGAIAEAPIYLGVMVRAHAPGDSLFARGMRAYDAREWVSARDALVRARAAGAAPLPADFFAAAAALMAGDARDAADGFARVLAAGETPYAPEAHYFRAKALLRMNDVQGARAELAQVAISTDPLAGRARALSDTLAHMGVAAKLP